MDQKEILIMTLQAIVDQLKDGRMKAEDVVTVIEAPKITMTFTLPQRQNN